MVDSMGSRKLDFRVLYENNLDFAAITPAAVLSNEPIDQLKDIASSRLDTCYTSSPGHKSEAPPKSPLSDLFSNELSGSPRGKSSSKRKSPSLMGIPVQEKKRKDKTSRRSSTSTRKASRPRRAARERALQATQALLSNDAEDQAEKRYKHNQAEKRRRSVIADTMKELAALVDCQSNEQKSHILRNACEKVHELQQQVQDLTVKNQELQAQRSACSCHAQGTQSPDSSPSPSFSPLGPLLNEPFALSPPALRSHRPICRSLVGCKDLSSLIAAATVTAVPDMGSPDLPTKLIKSSIEDCEQSGSSAKTMRLFDDSAVGMIIIDLNGHVIDCNYHFAQLVGMSRQLILSQETTCYEPAHPAYLAITPAVVAHLVRNPSTTCKLRTHREKDGIQTILQATCWAVCDSLENSSYHDDPHSFELDSDHELGKPTHICALVEHVKTKDDNSDGMVQPELYFKTQTDTNSTSSDCLLKFQTHDFVDNFCLEGSLDKNPSSNENSFNGEDNLGIVVLQ
jgi:PAS domain S-box-containing protein